MFPLKVPLTYSPPYGRTMSMTSEPDSLRHALSKGKNPIPGLTSCLMQR
jgi:hypothetical protein